MLPPQEGGLCSSNRQTASPTLGLPPKGPSLPKLHRSLHCKPLLLTGVSPKAGPVYSGRQTQESRFSAYPGLLSRTLASGSVSREGSTHVGSGLDLVQTDTRMHTHLLCLTSAHCLRPAWKPAPRLPVPFPPAPEKRNQLQLPSVEVGD